MIRTEGLTRTFRRRKQAVEAVKDVHIAVEPGELVAFLGPNGAGKSTTLRMLTGLLLPTSGTAEVVGYDVAREPARVRSHIGYVGQGNSAGHSYRVFDELHNQGRFYGLTQAESNARARELMSALELSELGERVVSSLSGGQRRRLDVAMGLMNRPPLLFLDEPSTGMDPQSRANLWQHILRMRQEHGMTLVLTTHYLEEADAMSERVIIIDRGSVIADSTASRLKRDHAADVLTLSVAPLPGPGGRDRAAAAVRAALAAQGKRGHLDEVASPAGQPPGNPSVQLRISLDRGPERLPRILYAVAAHGVEVRAAELDRASLDDVFLNLTGRSLRETEVAA